MYKMNYKVGGWFIKCRLLLVGFGTVGRGFAEILIERAPILKNRYNIDMNIVGISTLRHGSVYSEKGIDVKTALKLAYKGLSLETLPKVEKGLSSLELIREKEYDVLIELTPTNLRTGEPGLTHIREGLLRGKHVVTTNKGPIALAYRELKSLAAKKNVEFRFEGTIMSGTPVITLTTEIIKGDYLEEVYGIVNGTNNFILTLMEQGLSFEKALHEAQRLGYAETDPSMDIEGWDAVAKATIIANVIMGGDIKVQSVEREGIEHLTSRRVKETLSKGRRIKHLIRVVRKQNSIEASVRVEEVDMSHILAHVMGAKNCLILKYKDLGEIAIYGPGAGGRETGQAVLSDILTIYT